jgi:hypothetical protein
VFCIDATPGYLGIQNCRVTLDEARLHISRTGWSRPMRWSRMSIQYAGAAARYKKDNAETSRALTHRSTNSDGSRPCSGHVISGRQIGCFSVGFAPKTAGELIDIAARLVVICVLALLTRLIVRFRKNLSIAVLTDDPRRSWTDRLPFNLSAKIRPVQARLIPEGVTRQPARRRLEIYEFLLDERRVLE